jgi:hypothetical protein
MLLRLIAIIGCVSLALAPTTARTRGRVNDCESANGTTIAGDFTYAANQFAADYEAYAKEAFPGDPKKQKLFLKYRGQRAVLRSMAAILEDFDSNFSSDDVSRELLKVDADFSMVGKDLIIRLLDSDFMANVGQSRLIRNKAGSIVRVYCFGGQY